MSNFKLNSVQVHITHTWLFIIAFICLIGTFATNVQQYAQYGKEKERISKQDELKSDYDDMMFLYQAGLIDEKPEEPVFIEGINSDIATPYNCLNIPISIIFWTLAFFSFITFILTMLLKPDCPKSSEIKLYIMSSLALLSSVIGAIYWAINYHW